jgi:thiol-disulfide isomerase/thioredoxin
MTSVRRGGALLLALTALVALSGCTSLRGTNDGGYIPGEGGVTEIALDNREKAVDLEAETVDDGDLDLADLRGEVVVVNVWWSGCAPCRVEMPMLVEASEELDAKFVGINTRDLSLEAVRAFEKSAGVTYPSYFDPGGETLLAFGPRYSPRAMPTTLVLDRQGRVAAVISGAIPSKTTLADLVEEIAAEDG